MSEERASVTFREWKETLASEPWAADIKAQTARDIMGFLRHCKVLHSPASIATAKGYIAEREAQACNTGDSPRANRDRPRRTTTPAPRASPQRGT